MSGGWKEAWREWIYVYIADSLSCIAKSFSVVQKLAQHCKPIILQGEKKKRERERNNTVPATTASKRKKYLEIKKKKDLTDTD